MFLYLWFIIVIPSSSSRLGKVVCTFKNLLNCHCPCKGICADEVIRVLWTTLSVMKQTIIQGHLPALVTRNEPGKTLCWIIKKTISIDLKRKQTSRMNMFVVNGIIIVKTVYVSTDKWYDTLYNKCNKCTQDSVT